MSVTFSTYQSDDYVNMCNRNALDVLNAIGISSDDLCGEINVNILINLCQNWLKNHIDKIEGELLPSFDGQIIDCGREPGYLNKRIMELNLLAQRAKKNNHKTIIYG